MPEPGPSTLWLLTPEQLIVLCDLLDIAALPYSRYVTETDEPVPAHVTTVGLRSAAIARLIADDDDGDRPRVESSLARALRAFVDAPQEAVGRLMLSRDQIAFIVSDGLMLSLREQDEQIELRLEPAVDGHDRLRQKTQWALDSDSAVEDESTAYVAVSRWDRLMAGGPVRSADDPLVARAAQLMLAGRFGEASCLRLDPGNGYTGATFGWLDGGAVALEPELPEGADEPHYRLRTGVDVRAELEELWSVLTPVVSANT